MSARPFLASALALALVSGTLHAQAPLPAKLAVTTAPAYGVRLVWDVPPVQAGTKLLYTFTISGFDPNATAAADSFTVSFGAAAGAQLDTTTYAGPMAAFSAVAVNAAGDLSVALAGGRTFTDPITFTIETPYIPDPPGPALPAKHSVKVFSGAVQVGRNNNAALPVMAAAAARIGDVAVAFPAGTFAAGTIVDLFQTGGDARIGTGIAESDGSADISLSRPLVAGNVWVGERTQTSQQFEDGDFVGRIHVRRLPHRP